MKSRETQPHAPRRTREMAPWWPWSQSMLRAVKIARGVCHSTMRSRRTVHVGMTTSCRQDGQGIASDNSKREYRGRSGNMAARERCSDQWEAWHRHQFGAEFGGFRAALVRSKILLHLQARKNGTRRRISSRSSTFVPSFWYHVYHKSDAPSAVRLGPIPMG